MVKYETMKDILNNSTRENVNKASYTLSPIKFNDVSDFMFRIVLFNKIGKLTKASAETKGEATDELMRFILTKKEYSYVNELHKVREKIKSTITQNNLMKNNYEQLDNQSKLEVEAIVNKKANLMIKEVFLSYVDICKKHMLYLTEENYNFLFSETIEKYFSLPEDLENFKNEERERLKKEYAVAALENEKKDENANIAITSEIKKEKKSFFARLFKK